MSVIPNKKAQGDRDYVTMLMHLVRLGEPYNTDILMTLNVPDKHTGEEKPEELGQSESYKQFLEQSKSEFQQILQSFSISGDQAVKDLLGMWN